jgi:hypothetical protein
VGLFPDVGVIKLAERLTPEKKRKMRLTEELNAREVLPGGNTLIFKTRKN